MFLRDVVQYITKYEESGTSGKPRVSDQDLQVRGPFAWILAPGCCLHRICIEWGHAYVPSALCSLSLGLGLALDRVGHGLVLVLLLVLKEPRVEGSFECA